MRSFVRFSLPPHTREVYRNLTVEAETPEIASPLIQGECIEMSCRKQRNLGNPVSPSIGGKCIEISRRKGDRFVLRSSPHTRGVYRNTILGLDASYLSGSPLIRGECIETHSNQHSSYSTSPLIRGECIETPLLRGNFNPVVSPLYEGECIETAAFFDYQPYRLPSYEGSV